MAWSTFYPTRRRQIKHDRKCRSFLLTKWLIRRVVEKLGLLHKTLPPHFTQYFISIRYNLWLFIRFHVIFCTLLWKKKLFNEYYFIANLWNFYHQQLIQMNAKLKLNFLRQNEMCTQSNIKILIHLNESLYRIFICERCFSFNRFCLRWYEVLMSENG